MKKNILIRSIKEALQTLKNLLPYITEHRASMVLVIFMMLISVSISVSMGFGISFIFDKFPEDSVAGYAFLNNILLVVIFVVLMLALINYISNYTLQKVATKISESIRCDIFNNVVENDLAYIEKQSSGEIQTRIVADTNAVGRFLTTQIPIVVSAILSLSGGLFGAFYINSKLTFIVLICIPLIFLPFLLFAKKLRFLGEKVQLAISNVGRFSGEVFRNIKVTKAYNKEVKEKQTFSNYAAETTGFILSSTRLSLAIRAIVGSLASIGAAFLLWHIAKSIYANTMTVGELVAFAYFARLIVSSAQQFIGVITSLNIIVGKAKKVIEFLNIERHRWPSLVNDFNPLGSVEFQNVSFSYPTRPSIAVLKGVSLSIEAGSHVAIVGTSGAGKSTIFDLILRLYEPQQGNIYVDGIDIKTLEINELRKFIGFVPQKESLITGTVFDNISYGTNEANEESIKEAAKKAYADAFIEQLPQGYDTDLGEIGGRLSGGQKQRLSLARALIREPQILLLDEVNSALDTKSDSLISQAIKQWAEKENKTVITIAHRLSSALHADSIIVMDKGFVVAQGRHEELLKKSDLYRVLYSSGIHNQVEALNG